MTKSGRYRIFATIALQTPSESELRRFHDEVSSMSPSAFVELVRDIEDEVGNSLSLTVERNTERSSRLFEAEDVFHEIDSIRKNRLRLSVVRFAESLTSSIHEIKEDSAGDIPYFDSRRGLQAWIERLVRKFGEQFVLHAAIRVERIGGPDKESDWKLR